MSKPEPLPPPDLPLQEPTQESDASPRCISHHTTYSTYSRLDVQVGVLSSGEKPWDEEQILPGKCWPCHFRGDHAVTLELQ